MVEGDIWLATIRQQLHGQLILNTFHYRVSATPVPGVGQDAASVALVIGNKLVPAMKLAQSQELTHESVTAQKVFPKPVELAGVSTGNAGPGSIAGDSLPTSMSCVITKITRFAGRKYRGRAFLAGIPVTHESNSSLDPADKPLWDAIADAFNDQVTTGGATLQPCLFHRAAQSYTLLETAQVRSVLRNQRRRQVGVGQ